MIWSRLSLWMIIAVLAAGCGAHASVGYRIPGTPVSLGMGVPLDRIGQVSSDEVVFRQVTIDSRPAGAEIVVNGQLVGSTPSEVMVPFEKGLFGRAKGSSQVLLKKRGYNTEGFRVFPAKNGVKLQSEGAPMSKITRTLRSN